MGKSAPHGRRNPEVLTRPCSQLSSRGVRGSGSRTAEASADVADVAQLVRRRLRRGHAKTLFLGAALLGLLTLVGCSESDTGGSESGNAARETTRQTTASETTAAPKCA